MTTMFRLVCRYTPLLFIMAVSCPAWADQGKELFEKQCASCHTIGGGDSGGPDLKGVVAKRPAAWLERVIAEPEKLTAEKDPVQAELVKKYGFEMPNLGVSRDNARKIVAFLGGEAPSASTKAPSTTEPPAGQAVEVAVTPELIQAGRELFTGGKRFSKGGAPCIACHAFSYPGVRGASLASDLTYIYEGMGRPGMKGVLKSLNFPIMKHIYADKPLTDEEVVALIAFASDAAGKKETEAGIGTGATGALTFACIIIGLTLYKRRIG